MIQIRSSYDAMKQKAVKREFPAPYSTHKRVAETVDAQFDALWRSAG